ncbi:MAG: flagellar hook-basal body complex protein FliE [Candidatus Melainabacteria bacterium RIFOXYA12_FULL_32_12]|nr:MAG: flagellar hook-basal body complex protein FliE [Candidatus Melainabacteria bacterium GWF2_32_7]OGI18453.1 MAG: flagellar hook-basal body complex protein FliE [Candidatus Melainabacteria bacterium RIFOXYA2_FULL_32_9]OGI30988.1 MAG: flagellar hook-basal body complex protein FliE [Candidatus Melainabacteria bacterium RIFOXYA12_FULL_32_12]
MNNHYIPKVQLREDIAETKLNTFQNPMRLNAMGTSPEVPQFKEVLTGMVKELDSTVKAPDQVMQDAMLGNGADIHDVMIAISKAELGINVATQITSKVVQAYEKVISIQV